MSLILLLELIHHLHYDLETNAMNGTKCNRSISRVNNINFNPTRTRGSSHGETSQSGGAQQRRVTTLPSVRGVGSRTKVVLGAHSRNSSRRSKNEDVFMNMHNVREQMVDYNVWEMVKKKRNSDLPINHPFNIRFAVALSF